MCPSDSDNYSSEFKRQLAGAREFFAPAAGRCDVLVLQRATSLSCWHTYIHIHTCAYIRMYACMHVCMRLRIAFIAFIYYIYFVVAMMYVLYVCCVHDIHAPICLSVRGLKRKYLVLEPRGPMQL